jgi:hypothetical protein
MNNQTAYTNKDLEFIKNHEKKIQEYRERLKVKNTDPVPYKHLAYQVKNPFKGV